MKKLFVFTTSLLLVACNVHENEKVTYDYEVYEEPQIVTTTSYIYPKTKQPVSTGEAVDSTYMTEQTEKIQQVLAKTDASVKQEKTAILITLPHKVAFGTNQTTLEQQFEPTLSAMAKIIKEYDRTRIKIIGYTDNVGPVVSNKALSLRRANAISNFLRLNGVDINRIVVDGLGPENPLASNKTVQGREKNHRVEITLTNIQ